MPSVAPDAGPLERDHVLRDSGAAVLLTTGVTAATASEVEKVPVDVTATSASGVARRWPGLDRVALILYTSGTTGPQEGVVLAIALQTVLPSVWTGFQVVSGSSALTS